MFCPKCGTENADGSSFCRGCGSNISLVPQALTGTLRDPYAADERNLSRRERRDLRRERKRKKPPSIEGAITPFFGGIGFILVALAIMLFMPDGYMWGFWMFIPAFFMIGSGVSEYMRWKHSQQTPPLTAYTPPSAIPPAPTRATELYPPRPTSEIYAPGSVTEGTTKLLDHDQ